MATVDPLRCCINRQNQYIQENSSWWSPTTITGDFANQFETGRTYRRVLRDDVCLLCRNVRAMRNHNVGTRGQICSRTPNRARRKPHSQVKLGLSITLHETASRPQFVRRCKLPSQSDYLRNRLQFAQPVCRHVITSVHTCLFVVRRKQQSLNPRAR